MRFAQRRRLFLAVLRVEQRALAKDGRRLTWTEDDDGVTVLLDGQRDSRITWAELVRGETLLEADPAVDTVEQVLGQLQREFDNDGQQKETGHGR